MGSCRHELPLFFAILLGSGVAAPIHGWTPGTERSIAREGARLAPPDLHRQIVRRNGAFERGVGARDGWAPGERLDDALVRETTRAVKMIQTPEHFDDVVYQLGVVCRLVAVAHDPLIASDADREEGRFAADYPRYAESADGRFPLVFYGFRRGFDDPKDVARLVVEAVEHGRSLYPSIGREYRRISFGRGAERFDDRSTAFGVTSLAWTYAATDVGEVLRYIWLQAGGADPRQRLPTRGAGARLLRIPRSAPRTTPRNSPRASR